MVIMTLAVPRVTWVMVCQWEITLITVIDVGQPAYCVFGGALFSTWIFCQEPFYLTLPALAGLRGTRLSLSHG